MSTSYGATPPQNDPRDPDRAGDDRVGPDPVARDRESVVAREKEEYGGIKFGSAFFGWLTATGTAVILTALAAAAGAAFGLNGTTDAQEAVDQASENAETIGIVGGILLLAVLLIAYYAGGYVAGRMSRFSGPKQGIGVWLIGLAVTIVLAVAGALLGAEYNVLSQLNLPRIPIGEGSLTTGGLIALAAIVLGTLLAAVAGGKVGTRYHRKIDRVAV